MDLEKHIGDKNAQDIIDKLELYEKPFTNGLDLLDMDNALLPDAKRVPAPGTSSIAPSRPGTVADARVLSPVDGDQPLRGPTGAGSAVSVDRKPAVTAPSGISAPVSGLPAAGSLGQGSSPSAGDSAAFQRLEMTDATNLLAKLNSAGKGGSSSTNPAVLIDFSLYATNVDLLGDGAAKQQLRKLDDDLFLAQQDLGQSIIKLEGSRRLLTNGFITKTEFDGDDLAVSRNKVRVDAAKTALELYKKYEFTKASEEFVSKYDESLRALERARKEAVSKLAQARARLKSAEGRYRIALEQRQELSEQVSNCTIRAKRPGLVVYGGSDERRFYGGEEQIREGATVRERQSIITIPDMTQMAVKVRIHESHVKKVKKGQKARIQVDAFPDEKLEGEVIKVGVLPDSQNRWMNPDMKVYLTSIRIDGVRDWLKPGMSAKVEILVKELTNVVYVPIQAVSTVNAKQVCYLHRLGESEQRPVEIGDFNDEFIEIKSGLRENDRVLLRAPVGTEPEQLPAEGEEDGPAKGTPAAPKPAGATPAATAAPRPAQPAAAGPPPGAPSSSPNRAN
jgi:multidrug efflux pump subunit AcrA (membrane-fusion protein)